LLTKTEKSTLQIFLEYFKILHNVVNSSSLLQHLRKQLCCLGTMSHLGRGLTVGSPWSSSTPPSLGWGRVAPPPQSLGSSQRARKGSVSPRKPKEPGRSDNCKKTVHRRREVLLRFWQAICLFITEESGSRKQRILLIAFFSLIFSSEIVTNAAFTHAGLTTRYGTKSLYKSIFVLSRSGDI